MKKIYSIADYLSCLNPSANLYSPQHYVVSATFYRGQSNKDWKLSPRLYRERLFEQEGAIIKEILHTIPNEFNMDRFDILSKLQHFGFPTRLLDVTSNPLVALYFACADKNEILNDGVVYIFTNLPASWSDDPLVELVMDFVFEYTPKNLWLEEFLRVTKEKYRNKVGRLMPEDIDMMLHDLTIPAIAVIPKKSNPRLTAQDGAFFLFGMKKIGMEKSTNPGTLGRIYYSFEPAEVSDEKELWHRSEKIIIPAEIKTKILEELDLLGINQQKLFPDIVHQLQYLFEKYKGNNKNTSI